MDHKLRYGKFAYMNSKGMSKIGFFVELELRISWLKTNSELFIWIIDLNVSYTEKGLLVEPVRLITISMRLESEILDRIVSSSAA